jgi:hypothetical protein
MVVMTYSATTRDRYRLAVAAVSGAMTFGALSATGLIAGAAAADHEADLAQKAAEQQAAKAAYQQAKRDRAALIRANKRYVAQLADNASHPHVVLRHRPHVTKVTTQYVGSGGSSSVGGGGSVSYPSGGGGGSSSGGGGGGGTPAPPPPPPPPPAPSTGS